MTPIQIYFLAFLSVIVITVLTAILWARVLDERKTETKKIICFTGVIIIAILLEYILHRIWNYYTYIDRFTI